VAWRKTWRDLWLNKARTALVVLSIAVSVFAVGTIVGAYGIMCDSMKQDRLAWVPIHFSLWGWITEKAEDAVLRDPAVVEAERLVETSVRWRLEGDASLGASDWRDANLYAREDYTNLGIGRKAVPWPSSGCRRPISISLLARPSSSRWGSASIAYRLRGSCAIPA
jgi:putative ABC transport system permease protein